MNIRNSEFIGRKVRPVEFALFVKWLLRIKRAEYLLPDGNKFYIDPISDFGLKLVKHNSYETSMTNQVRKFLKKNDVFIDIGANEGFFSILAGQVVGKEGVVIAIEPQQRLWEIIVKNVEINGLSNVMLLPYGIGSSAGEAEMHLYPNLNSGASSLAKSFNFKVSLRKFRKAIYSTKKISIKTLDEILPGNKNIKLMKMDIEGFELEALKGATQLLGCRTIENLLIEMHPEALQSMAQSTGEIDKLLSRYGYVKNDIEKNLVLYSLS